jgi:acetolactate synthase-1/2/3 large subunit
MAGKGALSEEDPLSLCDISSRAAQAALREADAMLAVGTRFPQIDTHDWKMPLPQPLIHLEADASAIGADYPTAVGLPGDVKVGLQQLLAELRVRPHTDGWGARRAELRAEAEQGMRSHPYLTVLREELARDAILINDVNYFSYHTRFAFPIYDPRCFAYPYCYVTMGYGLPGALGAKAAFPDRQVVSLSGDGGFLMTAQELATAVQFDLPVVALVVNDHCLTSIRRGQEREFGATLGVELHNPDFVKFAESFGARAWRVDTPEAFRLALRAALAAGVASVIEIAYTWPDS